MHLQHFAFVMPLGLKVGIYVCFPLQSRVHKDLLGSIAAQLVGFFSGGALDRVRDMLAELQGGARGRSLLCMMFSLHSKFCSIKSSHNIAPTRRHDAHAVSQYLPGQQVVVVLR